MIDLRWLLAFICFIVIVRKYILKKKTCSCSQDDAIIAQDMKLAAFDACIIVCSEYKLGLLSAKENSTTFASLIGKREFRKALSHCHKSSKRGLIKFIRMIDELLEACGIKIRLLTLEEEEFSNDDPDQSDEEARLFQIDKVAEGEEEGGEGNIADIEGIDNNDGVVVGADIDDDDVDGGGGGGDDDDDVDNDGDVDQDDGDYKIDSSSDDEDSNMDVFDSQPQIQDFN
jgi:hypothetical protein